MVHAIEGEVLSGDIDFQLEGDLVEAYARDQGWVPSSGWSPSPRLPTQDGTLECEGEEIIPGSEPDSTLVEDGSIERCLRKEGWATFTSRAVAVALDGKPEVPYIEQNLLLTERVGRGLIEPGTVLKLGGGENYTIEKRLGGGLVTEVYKAQREDGREVAIKAGYPPGAVREIKNYHTLARAVVAEPLDNFPNKVRRNYYPTPYSGVRAAQFGVAIVELAKGKDLEDQRHNLPLKQRWQLGLQMGHALAIAEDAGILLRDLKLNIFKMEMEGDSFKMIDWNVTDEVDTTNPYQAELTDRYRRIIIYSWLNMFAQLFDGAHGLDINIMRLADYRDVKPEEIEGGESIARKFRQIVLECVIQRKFLTIREAYLRALEISGQDDGAMSDETESTHFEDILAAWRGSLKVDGAGHDASREALKQKLMSDHEGNLTNQDENLDISFVLDIHNMRNGLMSALSQLRRLDPSHPNIFGKVVVDKKWLNDESNLGRTVAEILRNRIGYHLEREINVIQARNLLREVSVDLGENGPVPGVNILGIFKEVYPEFDYTEAEAAEASGIQKRQELQEIEARKLFIASSDDVSGINSVISTLTFHAGVVGTVNYLREMQNASYAVNLDKIVENADGNKAIKPEDSGKTLREILENHIKVYLLARPQEAPQILIDLKANLSERGPIPDFDVMKIFQETYPGLDSV
ncbi:MAG: hypothetical protein AAB588_06735 [Patescibacteria group bacterium]